MEDQRKKKKKLGKDSKKVNKSAKELRKLENI